ncbi:MAG: 50S ribosomal protein L22 [Deinococcus sp.]|nr:50S ribosomal protein L22 [Deinococcus sp.]
MKATARYVRASPRKMRLVVNTIRGKSAIEAREILRFLPKGYAETVGKVLASAIANAENNTDKNINDLVVAQCYVGDGPSMRRYYPRARGRPDMLRHRSCHVTIVLGEKNG